MSRLWLLSLLCLSLDALFFVQPTQARYDLSVNEAKTKLTFQELAPQLSLAVVNGSGKLISTMVHIELVDTSEAVISRPIKNGSSAPKQLLSTPRIRGFFPETLLWQPELTTDKQGRAQLDFKLADHITTWKMAVIGSTEDGEMGTAETEIRAFQPFFAELDPPRVLTQGNRISLPVVLRNYLENQYVNLELK
ncbi:MAG TPA: alpha-2-macroglobulin family protein [Pyrinomonadaceae bacterium]|nr:alpha-2-macroglobulin family protein [Pyrinomonadaceae bacterium]